MIVQQIEEEPNFRTRRNREIFWSHYLKSLGHDPLNQEVKRSLR